MKVVLDSNSSNAFLNLLRKVLRSRLPSARPIAFKVGSVCDVCNTADSVEEDMSEFISNVSSSFFAMNEDSELAVYTCSVNGTLSLAGASSELAASGVTVLDLGTDEVLHTLSPIPVTIYFRRAPGRFTARENEEFLAGKGVDTSELIIINSRHCPIKNLTYEEVDQYDGKTEYNFSLETDGSITSESAVASALNLIAADSRSLLSS